MDNQQALQKQLEVLLEVRAIHNRSIDELNSQIGVLIRFRGQREDALDELKGRIISIETQLSGMKRDADG